jgi:hypothetical protein
MVELVTLAFRDQRAVERGIGQYHGGSYHAIPHCGLSRG